MQLLSLIACGVVSGVLSGMLGIGGGLVVVPALYLILRAQDVALPLIPQAAIATSLAAMIPTALASSWAQARRGALDPAWLRRLAPGVALGAALGAVLAGSVRGPLVSLVFVAYASFFAWRMLRAGNAPPRPQRIVFASGPSFATPPFALRLPVGAIACLIGLSSAVAGIGGAIVTVPYLVACSMDIKRAVAVSSAVSFVIALVATAANAVQAGRAGMVGGALHHDHLFGAIHWPAALVIGATALLCAPCGVACAHRLPMLLLKRTFALLTLAAAAGTLASVLR